MKIAGDYRFKLPIRAVWDGIFDPEILAASLPGCESLERDGDVMRGALVIKIGPVKGKFKGTVAFSDVEAPHRCSMTIDGRGTQGFVKATAEVSLEQSGGETVLTYSSDSKVGGKIAAVGNRLIGASARAVAKQSLEALDETLTRIAEAEAAAVEPTAEPEEPEPEPDAEEPEPEPEEPGVEARSAARAAAIEKAHATRKTQAEFARGVASEVAKDLVSPWLRVILILAIGIVIGLFVCRLTH